MEPGKITLGTILVLLIIVISLYVWYYYIGWNTYGWKSGDLVSWTSNTGASNIRFNKSIFKITYNGQIYKKDVTQVLNSMAISYKNTTQTIIKLDKPLNPFSFVIDGVNDSKTVSDPETHQWKKADVQLSGQWRII